MSCFSIYLFTLACQLTQQCSSFWKCLKIIHTLTDFVATCSGRSQKWRQPSTTPCAYCSARWLCRPSRREPQASSPLLEFGLPSDSLGPEESSGCYLCSSEPRPPKKVPVSSLSGTQVNGPGWAAGEWQATWRTGAAPAEATADQPSPQLMGQQTAKQEWANLICPTAEQWAK